jgi:hypothetical protein
MTPAPTPGGLGVAGCELVAAVAAVRVGDGDAAERANGELLVRARRLGDAMFETWSRLLGGWIAERRGEPQAADDQYRAALEREPLFSAFGGSPAARSLLALAALARSRGDLAEADRLELQGRERAEREADADLE